MKLFHLPIKWGHWAPGASVFSVAAANLGVTPVHTAILQVALILATIIFLKVRRGLTFRFAVQTVAGVAHQRQVEILKLHVPAPMRRAIETGNFDFDKTSVMDSAVVGFVDIAASAALANVLELKDGFELKKEFLRLAAVRANQLGIVILNHTGDGFLFLANPDGTQRWRRNLIVFAELLMADFDQILQLNDSRMELAGTTGLRVGVASGSVVLGCLGASPSNYTAVGPQVNLAARLCAKAEVGEIAFSESVWENVRPILADATKKFFTHELKGFNEPTAAVHFRFKSRQA